MGAQVGAARADVGLGDREGRGAGAGTAEFSGDGAFGSAIGEAETGPASSRGLALQPHSHRDEFE